MFFSNFDHLDNNLDIFLEYDIKPDNIIRDIGIFKHSEKSILERLKRVKAANITKVMPWMIKCLDAVFERFDLLFAFIYCFLFSRIQIPFFTNRSAIQSRVEEREALGNHDNVESFLVGYLNIDEHDATEMMKKYPRLSVRKVRKVIKILLNALECVSLMLFLARFIAFSDENNHRLSA